MNRRLYIVEGAIEERFFRYMSLTKFISPGKIHKFNLMQKNLCENDNIMTMIYQNIYCAIDTDVVGKEHIDRLLCNIRILEDIARGKIFLLPQYRNFEDELRTMGNTENIGQLLNIKHSTQKDAKVFLAQKVNYATLNIDLSKYCCNYEKFEKILQRQGVTLPRKVKIVSASSCK